MQNARHPAVAGMFYPSDRNQLSRMVDSYISGGSTERSPEALIVPHAGFVYSGAIAGAGYSTVKNLKASNILIIGPAHRMFVKGLASCSWNEFLTPMGKVPVNQELVRELESLPFVSINNEAHDEEHCIEVQLPFLQKLFRNFKIIPILAGDVDPSQIAILFEKLESRIDLILVSSDLSHYKDYSTAKEMDQNAAEAIENLNPEMLRSEQACGHRPIQGLLLYAKKRGLKAAAVMLKNSGDVKGDRSSVVGYGSFAFYKNSA